MNDEEASGGCEEDQGGGAVLIRIHVPDLNIHKCLQFYKHDLVWDVKQQCLASLPKVSPAIGQPIAVYYDFGNSYKIMLWYKFLLSDIMNHLSSYNIDWHGV